MERIEKKRYFGSTLGWHWVRTVAFLLLFAEYTRLVLTSDQPPYRWVLSALLGLVFAFFLIMLIRAHRRKSQDT